jgi:oligopeptide transport system substrate-binding protein
MKDRVWEELGRGVPPGFRRMSRRNFLKTGGAGLAGTILLGTAGCGVFEQGGGQQQGGGGGGSKVFNDYYEGDIVDMVSTTTSDIYSFSILNNVMEGLYRLDANTEPQPAQAEGVEINGDKTVYTFTLKDGLRWSNGDPVVSEDFRYAWLRAMAPDTAGDYSFILTDYIDGGAGFLAGDVGEGSVGVEAPDEKTLVVTLAKPAPFFLGLTSFPTYLPLNQKFTEEQGDQFGLGADALLYNGPFTLTALNPSTQAVLEKNQDYWDKGNVGTERVNVRIIKEDETALNLYESGELDVFALAGQYFDEYQDSSEFKSTPYFSTYYLHFNQQDEALANANIRKAVQIGYDRRAVADRILNDGSRPAVGFAPIGIAGPGGETFREATGDTLPPFDAEEARRLFQQGSEELGQKPVLTVFVSDDDTSRDFGTFLQDQLTENLDAGVKITSLPFDNLYERTQAKDFQISAYSWIGDYNDPMTFMDLWLSDSGFNTVSFSSERYDELVNGAKAEPDNDRRMEMMAEAERILLEENAVIGPISHGALSRLEKPYLDNYVAHPYGAAAEYKPLRLEGK